MLCQLSYAPRFGSPIVLAGFRGSRVAAVAVRQRRALGTLFLLLAVFFVGIAITAATAGGAAWVIAGAATVLGLWLASLSFSSLRRRG